MPYIPENERIKYFYLNGEPGPDYYLVMDAVVDKFTGTLIWPDGSKTWYVNGNPHRLDGPAYEGIDGTKEWIIDGLRHRLDGPAIEWCDGIKEWWVNGKQVTKLECKLLNFIKKLKGLM